MRPFCILRHLTFFGLSMFASRHWASPLREHFALENPTLNADGAVCGAGLGEAILDVCAQGVQGHPALAIPLVARHLGAAQTSRARHPNALGTELHCGLHGFLHGAPERHPALELGGDVLTHQLCVGLGLADLLDVEEYLVVGQRLHFLLELLDARTALADHDAGARGVDVDLGLVGRPLDLDQRDASMIELGLDEALEADVLMQPLGILLLLVPLRVPALDDAQPETNRMRLLTHYSASATVTVM